MKEHLIEIQIRDIENAVKYIPLIRKLTKESITQINNTIQQKQSVITCRYTKEPEKLIEIRTLLDKLISKGAEIKITQNARGELIKEVDIDAIDNLIVRRKEISEEIETIIDLEVGE